MFPTLHSASKPWYDRALEVMPAGCSRRALYPMRSYAAGGEGSRLQTLDGEHLLDGSNNFMVLIHGHRHQATVEALGRQLGSGLCFGMADTSEVRLAEHIGGRVKALDQLMFCNSGSEAVMHALKAARVLTKRSKIVKCEGLYHGSYDFAEVSNAPPVEPGRQGFPQARANGPYMSPNIVEDVIVTPFNNLPVTEAIIKEHHASIAAILIDPLPSRIGYKRADRSFVEGLRSLCDSYGIILIFDEVASFRVAHGGAQSYYGVSPDLTVFGKIIGGGLPVGAVGGKEAMMRILDPREGSASMSFTGTFNANPLSMVAGLATLEAYDEHQISVLNAKGDRLRENIAAGAVKKGLPIEVSGEASFLAFYFAPRIGNDYHAVATRPEELSTVDHLWNAALDLNLLIDTSGRMNISTAYSDADIEEAGDIVLAAAETALNKSIRN
ncbi:aspartate aminotransferase family protein [Phyllobacterium endophyticum]|uniref:Aspartate aminotransferase family protein n=1 Tax=Phyllobacterium endophyticum TaxID=1149773 RepID=A0A2P7AKF2_9HYPH|nr:aminotransferase class III-fold pyridoxal phosphate-dependent enzyme [Phyllobacterium endophyticum]MBB3237080.1 glutamate-1-semialdehyde 2,1-aminomutase [Phyllobacterium endophyticum]PSH54683.1 aspartate aminotransferase family protein [Phyllobacterium endophyticum]TYR40550.1 aminotransferase class III-fold pyridoxal phosphate-dependent enzyme [Phyllobacterium endophyticum]